MRESVLAYKFVVRGAIPFDESDPASFADAQEELERLRRMLPLDYSTDIAETTRMTTRKVAKDVDEATRVWVRDAVGIFGQTLDDATLNRVAAKVARAVTLPDDGAPVADLPPLLDRRPEAT